MVWEGLGALEKTNGVRDTCLQMGQASLLTSHLNQESHSNPELALGLEPHLSDGVVPPRSSSRWEVGEKFR